MEHLRCVVERITYHNEDNGYTVIRCSASGYHDLVTAVGNMAEVHVGSVLDLGGYWKNDSKYGQQFVIQSYEETLPATAHGIEKYLGSGMIRGVGPVFAKRIVRRFGKDTLDILENDPERLMEVRGIGRSRVESIIASWQEQKEVKNIMLFLQSHDVSTTHASKIYKTYGDQSLEVVRENPYRLADDIWGIGFRTADSIAEKLGFGHEQYERLRSGLMYTMNRLADEGHCFSTEEMLLSAGKEQLQVEKDILSDALQKMIADDDVKLETFRKDDGSSGTAIFLPPFFYSETGTARNLFRIGGSEGKNAGYSEGLAEIIGKKYGIEYDDVQKDAIRTALTSKIMLLTGGPGTGKTTVTQGIIAAFRQKGFRVLLAAPTGRAAKRMSEVTGLEARTIHRLLEYKPPEGYQKNEESRLTGDVLIVDECSMIDIMLMYNLLKAIPDEMRLILVGDVDQLPSVGAGNVLRDIIESGAFPVVRLTRIFRQAQKSRIIMNAHRINEGRMPDLSNGTGSDFFYIEEENPDRIPELITGLIKTRLPDYYHVASGDIQVLTPMQRGVIGAENLNRTIQSSVNPDGDGIRRGGYIFRANDKVMQIRNNYDKEVFNGDIGTVVSVDIEYQTLRVSYDGRSVEYERSDLDELVLAYAVTIHKSQGSEYPIVIMPVMMSHYVMLQRNLIYTGVTRARKVLVMIGTKKALSYAVRNVTVERRNTLLKQRLKDKEKYGHIPSDFEYTDSLF